MTKLILKFTIFLAFLLLIRTSSCKFNARIQLHVNTPSYTLSISDLEYLESFESQVVQKLTHYFSGHLANNTRISRKIHAYLGDFNEANGSFQDVKATDRLRPTESPICAYRLIRRVAITLRHIVSQRDCLRYFGPLCRQIIIFFLRNGWPNMGDVEGFAEKILRIQHVYDLDAKQLAKGKVDTVHTKCTLDSAHCYEVAIFAWKTEQYASAIEWLELAKERALADGKSSIPFIEFALWDAIEKHNKEVHGKGTMELVPVFFDKRISHIPKDNKNVKKLRTVQYEAMKGRKGHPYSIFNYWGLCKRDIQQVLKRLCHTVQMDVIHTEMEKSHLFCWNEFKVHPSFAIGPIKMEFLARNPDIVQMYEVLNEKEMQSFITDCDKISPHPIPLKSYKLHQPGTSFHYSSGYTPCKPLVGEHLDQKLERMTGLNIKGEASEDFFYLSYSVGGHINPHFDWMSDVKKGGETAFTSVGANAEPVKGSVILWFNHFSDGNEDMMTFHGGCPVVIGSKRGANRWVRYNPQFSKRKCGLKRMERYRVAVNGKHLPAPPLPGMEHNRRTVS